MDTCKGAVDLATKRRADCALKLEEAQRALQNADTDLDKNRAELAELETHVKCTSTSPSDNSLTVLSSAVARVLHDLKSVPTIPETVAACAEQEMTTPLAKLSSLAPQCVPSAESGAKHAANTNVGGDPVRRRLFGKSLTADVNMSDPSSQVFHDSDLQELTDQTALNFFL